MTRQLSLALVSLLSLSTACDLSAGGGGSTAPAEGPPKPTYERSFDEFADVPKQITAQVEWAAQPIANAAQLADEIAALRARLNIDGEQFASMFKVAFKDGTIEIGAQVELQEAKADIEATLAKAKQVGLDLQGLPGRVKTASKNISSLAMATPKLALKSTQELAGELKVAVGDGAVQIQADIDTVKKLPGEVKTQAVAAKDVLAELPAKAEASTKNLFAAMAGEPYEKQPAPTGDAAGSTDASADTGTVVAGTTTGSTTGTTTVAGTGTMSAPPVGAAGPIAPASIIAARVRTLETSAAAMGGRGDWLSAANAYEEAYVLTPGNQLLAFKIGNAAVKAKDCTRAQTYFARFVQFGDGDANPNEYQAAKKAMGELKTFACPARTPEDEAALAQTLSLKAQSLGAEGDWGGAALEYARAYQVAPQQHVLAHQVGVASWNAHACGDALGYFEHFNAVGDAKANRKQLREATKYIADAEAGVCKPEEAAQKDALARDLYSQAQSLELALDFVTAAGKYERAYELLPNNHAFAFRIAESFWGGQHCEDAEPHYRAFASFATDPRYAEDLTRTRSILARIDAHGCPNALWNAGAAGTATTATTSDTAAPASGGGDEAPPATAEGGGGAANCSITDEGSNGGWLFGLLILGAMLRRREHAR
jgi:MYXO-CTERM domain-containing protein